MKKLLGFGLPIVILSTTLLGACDEGSEPEPSKDAVENNGGKHEIVYAEVLNDGPSDDDSYPREEIAYMDHGKKKIIHTTTKHVYEHILKDNNESPYVVQDEDDDYHVYRQPYMIYGDDDIKGDVKDKKEVKSDK